jgi:hypothetical protein
VTAPPPSHRGELSGFPPPKDRSAGRVEGGGGWWRVVDGGGGWWSGGVWLWPAAAVVAADGAPASPIASPEHISFVTFFLTGT